jgi:sugar/nucleoside kinase (ribokinase family)
MKIGVVGTFIRDRIFPWRGKEAHSIGGIFFTVSYLANLGDTSTEIYPVCNLGYDFYPRVCDALARYDNVRHDGLYKHERANTRVTLTYTGPQTRDEVTSKPMPPVDFQQLRVLSDADAVIFNLITGVDVQLTALREFRRRSSALLYLDFHTRCLAIDAHGKRYYRRPNDWREWVELVDILQINEKEAQTLANSTTPLSDVELAAFAESVLALGPSVCNFTLADRGSLLVVRRGSRIHAQRIPPVKITDVVDIIGCGDAFEAAFVLHRLRGKSELQSAQYANLVAALNTTFIGSSSVGQIRNKIRRFKSQQHVVAKDLP